MPGWLHLIFLVTLFGITKAHHLIKVVILAGLGLAGLWMIHTLAQDYHKIIGGHGGGGGGGGAAAEGFTKYFTKRSVDNSAQYYYYYKQPTETPAIATTTTIKPPHIDWERILSRDPASCARSFICQLSAQSATELQDDERNILQLIKLSSENDNWASKEILTALKNGEQATNPSQCKKHYKFCPYSSRMMMNLLHYFGGR